MKKKILITLLTLITLSITACGNNDEVKVTIPEKEMQGSSNLENTEQIETENITERNEISLEKELENEYVKVAQYRGLTYEKTLISETNIDYEIVQIMNRILDPKKNEKGEKISYTIEDLTDDIVFQISEGN